MDKLVLFIDTSVLCNLLDVPGRNQRYDEIRGEFERYLDDGAYFVIPVTAVIETGNFIAQCSGDRRAAAERFVALLKSTADEEVPWQLHALDWNGDFLHNLCGGDRTGQELVDLLGNGQMGTGDVAILCERSAFAERTSFKDVQIWTLEQTLRAYG